MVDLEGCTLNELTYEATEGRVSLSLQCSYEKNWTVRCTNVLFFKVSNTLGDTEAPFFADTYVRELSREEADRHLRNEGYGYCESPSVDVLYHVHAEGATVVDIVCSDKVVITPATLGNGTTSESP
jgi:hypothetical protein